MRGFTLLELVIVIAIIGILAVIVLPSMVGALSKARDAKKMSELRGIQSFITVNSLDSGSNFPKNTADLLSWYTYAGTKSPKDLITGNTGAYKYVGVGCAASTADFYVGTTLVASGTTVCKRYQLSTQLEVKNSALDSDADTTAAYFTTIDATLTAYAGSTVQDGSVETCATPAACVFDLTN